MSSASAESSLAASDPSRLAETARELLRLEAQLVHLERTMRSSIERVAMEWQDSARNLVHYVALRQHDLRELQVQLSRQGLSSLGRCESCVSRSVLDASARAHECLALRRHEGASRELGRLAKARLASLSWDEAQARLHEHTHAILGPRPADRHIYIMVTAPSAKEGDRAWMAKMLRAGMNLLRINCAHESEVAWGELVGALGEARKETGKECRILMDLGGPKVRTGPIGGARSIATWKPERDDLGNVVAPARVVVGRASSLPAGDGGASLLLRDSDFGRLRKGDVLRFHDARGKRRQLAIEEVLATQMVASATDRAYVLDGVTARAYRDGKRTGSVVLTVRGGTNAFLEARSGDALVLTRRIAEGRDPERDAAGLVVKPGLVSCTLPAALDHLAIGHRVLFDDGCIQAVVEDTNKDRGDYLLRVVRTQKKKAKLRADKGINLPDTPVTVPSLSPEDLRALAFVARHADAVGLSFVRSPDDVRSLHEQLDRLGRSSMGVVLKIETRAAFDNLPRILLEGLKRPPLAVMIARGDLAIEVGFERLAELQEEVLWLCEASHVPTIWATQVLDTLARTGVPSRAEVTDAAASVGAECVMLNKGPFVDEAVTALSDILRRMENHHYKKRSLYRRLHVSTFAGGGS